MLLPVYVGCYLQQQVVLLRDLPTYKYSYNSCDAAKLAECTASAPSTDKRACVLVAVSSLYLPVGSQDVLVVLDSCVLLLPIA